MALSFNVREQVIERASTYHGEVTNQAFSEISEDPAPLEASHLNHDKSDPEYNTPEAVIALTPVEHYCYHLMFQEAPEHIGLNTWENDYAIRMCFKRAVDYLRDVEGIEWRGLDRNERLAIINRGKSYLSYYLCIPDTIEP